jgi:hypothetical protein
MTQAGYKPPEKPIKKAPKPQPLKKKKKKHSKKKKRISGAAIVSLVIFAAAVLIGAGTLYVYAVTQPYADAYLPGTMVMGYPLGGATQEDVALMKQAAGERVAVKAAGGIRSLDDLLAMEKAGATRFGTSAGVKIMEEAAARLAAGEEF